MAAPDPAPGPAPRDAFDAADLVRHGRFVKSLARELARDDDEADELAARAMAEAVARRPGSGAGLRAWLRTVVSRLAIRSRRDVERRERRERAAFESSAARERAAPPTVDLVARIELEHAIAAAFAQLEEPYQRTLFLRFFDDRTPTWIASEAGVPVDTVKTRLKRGLAKLREKLDEQHRGGRSEWKATAIALAAPGGAVVAITKAKVAAAAIVLIAVAGFTTRRTRGHDSRRDVETSKSRLASASETASDASRASSNGDAAAPVREAASMPFASGIVVDATGTPLAGVRLVPSLVFHEFDDQWVATDVDLDAVERTTLTLTNADGRFELTFAPRTIAGLFFFAHGFTIGEWFELSADPARNQDHRVVLAPAARASGRVVDSEGRPIARATVRVSPDMTGHVAPEDFGVKIVADAAAGRPTVRRELPWCMLSLQTDADGAFSIDCVNQRPCILRASAPGYFTFPDPNPDEWRRLVDVETRAVLVLHHPRTVLLDVRDSRTGKPIAHPRALRRDPSGRHVASSYLTNDERRAYDGWNEMHDRAWIPGRLEISFELELQALADPSGSLVWDLVVYAEGYRPALRTLTLRRATDALHETVDLEPDDGAPSLSGVVTGAARARVDARLEPQRLSQNRQRAPIVATVETGADGRFEFRGLPDADYSIEATAPGRAPACTDVEAPRHDLTLALQSAARLVVRVVDREGRVVPEQMVQVQPLDGDVAWCASSDADGVARFDDLPAGEVDVLAFAPHFDRNRDRAPRRFASTSFMKGERLTLVAGATTTADVPSLARVHVRLRVSFPDGTPAAGVKFEELSQREGTSEAAFEEGRRVRALRLTTDDQGRVEADLLPGTYQCALAVDALRVSRRFQIERRCDDEIVLTVPDRSRHRALRGRVVASPGGSPLAEWQVGAMVNAPRTERESGRRTDLESTVTDANGRFEFATCPTDELVLWSADPKYGDTPPSDTVLTWVQTPIESSTEDVLDLVLEVPRSTELTIPRTTLDLTATLLADGSPVPLVEVLVEGTIGRFTYALTPRSIRSDGEGRLVHPLLACDRYRISIDPPWERGRSSPSWKPCEVEAVPVDGVVRVRATLERAESR